MKDLVSTVITTYGRVFEDIERSIASVMRQTYQNIEIILVDDNEKDSKYRKSIESAIVKYPKVLYVQHDSNKGAQIARNTGIKTSRGKYIAFLDDDDEWLPTKIEKQLKLIDETIGLVYCKGFYVDEANGDVLPYANDRNFKSEVTYSDLLYGDYIGTTTQGLIPKKVFEMVGGFLIGQPARQDYEMWIRISTQFRCVGVNEPLFKHYIHKGDQISKSSDKAIKGMENIYNKYRAGYKQHPLAEVHILIHIGKQYRSTGNITKALQYFWRAVIKTPQMLLFDGPQLIRVIKGRRA
jgi:glycosyltransferase involved in cell wall biosynthesis